MTLKLMLKRVPWEAVIWLGGLITLALLSPTEDHATICPLSNLGFTFCPGCGLGRSISYLLHGHLVASFSTHPLGFFAVIILSFRIIRLFKQAYLTHGKSN